MLFRAALLSRTIQQPIKPTKYAPFGFQRVLAYAKLWGGQYPSGWGYRMVRLQVKLVAVIIGMTLVGGTVLVPSTAEAAKMTKAEKAAWKQANVACKGQAKGKKLGWFAKRKFVKGCLKQALKGYPNIDVDRMMRDVSGKPLPATHVDDYI